MRNGLDSVRIEWKCHTMYRMKGMKEGMSVTCECRRCDCGSLHCDCKLHVYRRIDESL